MSLGVFSPLSVVKNVKAPHFSKMVRVDVNSISLLLPDGKRRFKVCNPRMWACSRFPLLLTFPGGK